MKLALALGILFCCSTTLWAGTVPQEYKESMDEFEKEFNVLENSEEEALEKKELEKAEEQINEQNKKFAEGKSKFSEKLYDFSDLTQKDFEKEKTGALDEDEEMRNIPGVIPMTEEEQREWEERTGNLLDSALAKDINSLPKTYDARAIGLVTAVKSQGACGSCAAFGAAANMESCMIKAGANKEGLDMSEQYLVDCGYGQTGMNGCNGAWVSAYHGFLTYQKNGHAAHENQYPYLGNTPKLTCPSASEVPAWNSGAKVAEAGMKGYCTEQEIIKLLNEFGTVSGAIYASDSAFKNYAGGILTEGCSSTSYNHAIVFVGYGTQDGTDYWVIKNSWGSNWGEKGFMRIARGKNMCGMENISVVTRCEKTEPADPVPPGPPPPPPPPINMICDLSKIWGAITGNYRIRLSIGGVLYDSRVTCDNGKCTPRYPGPTNACVYICGQTNCDFLAG